MSEEGQKNWSLDKRIPIGLITILVAQTIAVGTWLGTVQARLNYVEGYIDNRQQDVSRLAVLETKIGNVQQTLQELKVDLQFLRERVK